jgi:hypothetical protein
MLHTKALDSSTLENCDPDLRGFIDSVIVPMLVREYITRHGSGIDIARPTHVRQVGRPGYSRVTHYP